VRDYFLVVFGSQPLQGSGTPDCLFGLLGKAGVLMKEEQHSAIKAVLEAHSLTLLVDMYVSI